MGSLAAEHLTRVLTALAGPGTRFRPDQLEAVEALVESRRRVLLVQATGWGKSATYWAATSARRAAGAGPTVVISPLLALMRDQTAAATRAGLRAETINSANQDEWTTVYDQLARGQLDVLLVSPERLGNPRFATQAAPLLAGAGLLVVDEAHCISDWGFDFRPDYQRTSHLLAAMAPDAPVLATTATANERVTADVAAQLGPDTLVLRGPLARASLQLAVVPGLDMAARFAWVSQALPTLPGSGIVYSLTVEQVTSLAAFLTEEGHAVAPYTGGTDPADRQRIEAQLRDNHLKAVVATSALGMGYDKPDLGFCLHVGSPDSPVAYYQQVGRAGRAMDTAAGILLPGAESDPGIWEYFATSSIPDPQAADHVLRLLAETPHGVTQPQMEAETGLRRGRLETLLKILRVDGAVDKAGSAWRSTGVPWVYDRAKYEAVVRARRAEADLMREYAAGSRCLMQILTEALNDPAAAPCGRCSTCTGRLPFPGRCPDPARFPAARSYLRRRVHILEPRKRWPSGTSRRGRLSGIAPGRAVAYAADPAWPEITAELAGPDAPPSHALLAALTQVLSRWQPGWDQPPTAVIAMPSRSHPQRVQGMAEHLAQHTRLPLLTPLHAVGPAPQADVASARRVTQLFDRLQLPDPATVPPGPVLLVDDTARTRWTLTAAAALLTDAGATSVLPLVGHQLP